MKNYLCSALLVILPLFLIAQGIVTVEPPGGGASIIFTDLQKAIDEAPSGSRVVVSGGGYGQGQIIEINKKVTIVGNGYHPDSSAAIGISLISNIRFKNNSSGSTIFGLKVGNIYFETTNSEQLTGIKISRCYVETIAGYCMLKNAIIEENIIGLRNFSRGSGNDPTSIYFSDNNTARIVNSEIKNNVITGKINLVERSSFTNNILLGGVCASGSLFKNNIIVTPTYCECAICTPSSSFFYNNIYFGVNIVVKEGLLNQGSGNYLNYINELPKVIFKNYSSENLLLSDFHLNNPQLNIGGTDGTPIGIYGGTRPWKPGAIPSNPHIQSKTIAPETDVQGRLNVNIRVKAQGN